MADRSIGEILKALLPRGRTPDVGTSLMGERTENFNMPSVVGRSPHQVGFDSKDDLAILKLADMLSGGYKQQTGPPQTDAEMKAIFDQYLYMLSNGINDTMRMPSGGFGPKLQDYADQHPIYKGKYGR